MKILFANICGGLEFLGERYGETNFGNDVLDEYIKIFASYEPDVLCLAEVHLEDEKDSSMVEFIAERLSLPHFDVLGTDKSHLVDGKILGNAILSNYAITNSDHFVIKSPRIEVDRPNGDHWILHDKGAQTVTLNIDGNAVAFSNLQYFPFHHFNRAMNEPDFAPERQSLVDHIAESEAGIIPFVTGDFNNKGFGLKEAFPELFQYGFVDAVETETTIVGDSQQLDHILYNPSMCQVVRSAVVEIPSDHFGLYTEFEIS